MRIRAILVEPEPLILGPVFRVFRCGQCCIRCKEPTKCSMASAVIQCLCTTGRAISAECRASWTIPLITNSNATLATACADLRYTQYLPVHSLPT